MTPRAQTLLDERRRCLLAFVAAGAPVVSPMAYWSDGDHLWMSTSSSTLKVRQFRADGECAALVPGAGEEPAVAVRGTVRVFRPGDPLGLILHGAAISAAMAALAVSNVPSMFGYVQDVTSLPARWAPHNRVVLRLSVEDAAIVAPPAVGPGVAPALPTVVPSAARRVLSGQRRVTLAALTPRLRVMPAVWGAGYTLALPDGERLPPGSPVAAVVDSDPKGRPTGVLGLSVRGEVDPRGALLPRRVTWWEGFRLQTADVPLPATTSGIVLPD